MTVGELILELGRYNLDLEVELFNINDAAHTESIGRKIRVSPWWGRDGGRFLGITAKRGVPDDRR